MILHRLALVAFLQGRAWVVLQVVQVELLTVVQGAVVMELLGDGWELVEKQHGCSP